MSPVLIYISFGREDDCYQLLYSLLSLIKYTQYFSLKDHKVVIYTDAPQFFEKYLAGNKYSIEIQKLDSEDLKKLKGGEKFQQVFRVKLALILQTLNLYKRNVLYLDADTYAYQDFIQELKISNQESGMCAEEGFITHKKNNENDLKIIEKYKHYFQNAQSLKMYNAGLILIHHENTYLIQNALNQMDEIFPSHQYYFLEQLLVSYHLSTHAKVKTFEKFIRHYWYQKEFTQKVKNYIQKLPQIPLDQESIPEMPLNAVPREKIYKSFIYQWPIKITRKLKKWKIIHEN